MLQQSIKVSLIAVRIRVPGVSPVYHDILSLDLYSLSISVYIYSLLIIELSCKKKPPLCAEGLLSTTGES
jgi:hypothetical protein